MSIQYSSVVLCSFLHDPDHLFHPEGNLLVLLVFVLFCPTPNFVTHRQSDIAWKKLDKREIAGGVQKPACWSRPSPAAAPTFALSCFSFTFASQSYTPHFERNIVCNYLCFGSSTCRRGASLLSCLHQINNIVAAFLRSKREI